MEFLINLDLGELQINHLSRVSAEERVPKMGQREGKIFVEKVAQELAHADIGPPKLCMLKIKIMSFILKKKLIEY